MKKIWSFFSRNNEGMASIRQEVGKQYAIGWPVSLGMLLMRSLSVVSMILVGHLCSAPAFAAVSLATSFANVTGHSTMVGLSSALATLASQAYGAKDLKAMNAAFWKSFLVLFIACMPISALWYWSAPFLIYCGQDPVVSEDAGQYLQAFIPSLWLYAALQIIQTYLQAQGITRPIAYTSAGAAIVHPLITWLMIKPMGLDALGSAAANAVTQTIWLVMLIVYIKYWGLAERVGLHFSLEELKATFTKLLPFLELALAGALMMAEWWAAESIVFLAGLLPDPEIKVSVMAIYQVVNALAYMVSYGAHVAANTRVGNELGRGKAKEARLAAYIAPGYAFLVGGCMAALLMILHNYYPLIFTANRQEVLGTIKTAPIAAFLVVADSIQAACTGILKGSGKQNIGYMATLLSYFAIGIPLALLLTFHYDLDLLGLCAGLAIGCWCYMLSTFCIVIWTNWEEEVIKAEQRLGRGRGRGRSGCMVFEDEKKKECSSSAAAVVLLEMEEGKKKEEEDDALRISVVKWTEKKLLCTIPLGRTGEGKVAKVHHKQDSCSTEEEEEGEEEEESKEDNKVDSSLTRSPVSSSFIRVASF